eukprot:363314-Chlamydomonas_euryale.AAC.1
MALSCARGDLVAGAGGLMAGAGGLKAVAGSLVAVTGGMMAGAMATCAGRMAACTGAAESSDRVVVWWRVPGHACNRQSAPAAASTASRGWVENKTAACRGGGKGHCIRVEEWSTRGRLLLRSRMQ